MSKNQGKTPKRRSDDSSRPWWCSCCSSWSSWASRRELINAGLGREFIRSSIEKQVNGTVRLAGLHLGRLGPQSVKGLQVVDRDGRTAVDANVEVNAGLLKLVTGSLAPLEIVVGGRVKGEIRKDGSISLTELAVTPSPKSGPAAPSTTPAAPAAMLPDFGPIKIRLDDVEVEIHDAVSGRDLTVQHLNGQFSYAPGGSTLLKLHGDTKSGLLNGSIDVDAESVFLFDESGVLAPDKATLRAELKLASVPVLYQEIDSRVDQLTLSATSEKLTDAVAISLDADAVVGGAAPSRLEGRLVVDQPMLPSGAAFALPRSRDRFAQGQRVPARCCRSCSPQRGWMRIETSARCWTSIAPSPRDRCATSRWRWWRRRSTSTCAAASTPGTDRWS